MPFMLSRLGPFVAELVVVSVLLGAGTAHAFAFKDQTRLPDLPAPGDDGGNGNALGKLAPFAPMPENGQPEPLPPVEEPESGNEQPSPVQDMAGSVDQVELTEDSAKRSLEVFILLKDKYQDTDIGEYETLEQFVAEASEGKALESDVKANGFESVTIWNNTIMSVSFAYAAISTTQEQEIRTEIENIRADKDIAEDLRQSLISGLESMLPSDANKAIIKSLNEDPAWAAKLKLLAEEDPGQDEEPAPDGTVPEAVEPAPAEPDSEEKKP